MAEKYGEQLFEVPISSGGQVKCFTPAAKVYLIEFTSEPDNRLKTPFLQALLLALDILESRHPPGVLITTSGITKFYSNGLDLEHANFTPHFFPDSLYALWTRLLTYPMPTIALLNGHAFAGALMTAMMHDYRIMNPARGYACLNEVELGVPLRPAMSSIFREKCAPDVYRTLVLEGKRYKAQEALDDKIIDATGELKDVLEFIAKRQLVAKPAKGVYGELKREMYRQTLSDLANPGADVPKMLDVTLLKGRERVSRDKRIAAWETRSKL